MECTQILSVDNPFKKNYRPKVGYITIKQTNYDVYEGVNTVGRNNCDILLLDPCISRLHAIITVIKNVAYLSDMGSANRTLLETQLLNDKECYLLKHNSKITFGNVEGYYHVNSFKEPEPITTRISLKRSIIGNLDTSNTQENDLDDDQFIIPQTQLRTEGGSSPNINVVVDESVEELCEITAEAEKSFVNESFENTSMGGSIHLTRRSDSKINKSTNLTDHIIIDSSSKDEKINTSVRETSPTKKLMLSTTSFNNSEQQKFMSVYEAETQIENIDSEPETNPVSVDKVNANNSIDDFNFETQIENTDDFNKCLMENYANKYADINEIETQITHSSRNNNKIFDIHEKETQIEDENVQLCGKSINIAKTNSKYTERDVFKNIYEMDTQLEISSDKETQIESISDKETQFENIFDKESQIENIFDKETQIANVSGKETRIESSPEVKMSKRFEKVYEKNQNVSISQDIFSMNTQLIDSSNIEKSAENVLRKDNVEIINKLSTDCRPLLNKNINDIKDKKLNSKNDNLSSLEIAPLGEGDQSKTELLLDSQNDVQKIKPDDESSPLFIKKKCKQLKFDSEVDDCVPEMDSDSESQIIIKKRQCKPLHFDDASSQEEEHPLFAPKRKTRKLDSDIETQNSDYEKSPSLVISDKITVKTSERDNEGPCRELSQKNKKPLTNDSCDSFVIPSTQLAFENADCNSENRSDNCQTKKIDSASLFKENNNGKKQTNENIFVCLTQKLDLKDNRAHNKDLLVSDNFNKLAINVSENSSQNIDDDLSETQFLEEPLQEKIKSTEKDIFIHPTQALNDTVDFDETQILLRNTHSTPRRPPNIFLNSNQSADSNNSRTQIEEAQKESEPFSNEDQFFLCSTQKIDVHGITSKNDTSVNSKEDSFDCYSSVTQTLNVSSVLSSKDKKQPTPSEDDDTFLCSTQKLDLNAIVLKPTESMHNTENSETKNTSFKYPRSSSSSTVKDDNQDNVFTCNTQKIDVHEVTSKNDTSVNSKEDSSDCFTSVTQTLNVSSLLSSKDKKQPTPSEDDDTFLCSTQKLDLNAIVLKPTESMQKTEKTPKNSDTKNTFKYPKASPSSAVKDCNQDMNIFTCNTQKLISAEEKNPVCNENDDSYICETQVLDVNKFTSELNLKSDQGAPAQKDTNKNNPQSVRNNADPVYLTLNDANLEQLDSEDNSESLTLSLQPDMSTTCSERSRPSIKSCIFQKNNVIIPSTQSEDILNDNSNNEITNDADNIISTQELLELPALSATKSKQVKRRNSKETLTEQNQLNVREKKKKKGKNVEEHKDTLNKKELLRKFDSSKKTDNIDIDDGKFKTPEKDTERSLRSKTKSWQEEGEFSGFTETEIKRRKQISGQLKNNDKKTKEVSSTKKLRNVTKNQNCIDSQQSDNSNRKSQRLLKSRSENVEAEKEEEPNSVFTESSDELEPDLTEILNPKSAVKLKSDRMRLNKIEAEAREKIVHSVQNLSSKLEKLRHWDTLYEQLTKKQEEKDSKNIAKSSSGNINTKDVKNLEPSRRSTRAGAGNKMSKTMKDNEKQVTSKQTVEKRKIEDTSDSSETVSKKRKTTNTNSSRKTQTKSFEKDLPRKPNLRQHYFVMFTMFRDNKQEKIVEKLGGKLTDNIVTATVLVTTEIRRSVKFLCAISLSKPIVSPQWLLECSKANTFLDPWKFLLKDKAGETRFDFQLTNSFKTSEKGLLLNGYSVYVTPSINNDIKEIIEKSGAKFKQTLPKSLPDNFFIVSCQDDKEFCLNVIKKKHPSALLVSTEAIFSSVLKQILDLKTHKMIFK